MYIIQLINNYLKRYIIKQANKFRSVEIMEIRTRQFGLLSVASETDFKIKNLFFLPYTLLSIRGDLLNNDGIKIGKMDYEKPLKIRGKSEEIFTSISEISIITSFFQALSNLLSHPIWIRNVGVATIKVLWLTVELPIDDVFEIHPSKIKILKERTDEEKALRLKQEEERRAQRKLKEEERREQDKIKSVEKAQLKAERKETSLQRRHKENYIPLEQRQLEKLKLKNELLKQNLEQINSEVNMPLNEEKSIDLNLENEIKNEDDAQAPSSETPEDTKV